jgi:hypothetical protein
MASTQELELSANAAFLDESRRLRIYDTRLGAYKAAPFDEWRADTVASHHYMGLIESSGLWAARHY